MQTNELTEQQLIERLIQKPLLILGGIATGKTVAIENILAYLYKEQKRTLVYDRSGELDYFMDILHPSKIGSPGETIRKVERVSIVEETLVDPNAFFTVLQLFVKENPTLEYLVIDEAYPFFAKGTILELVQFAKEHEIKLIVATLSLAQMPISVLKTYFTSHLLFSSREEPYTRILDRYECLLQDEESVEFQTFIFSLMKHRDYEEVRSLY